MKSYPISEHRYREQQSFLNELAVRHGFFTFRPEYHADPRDANTVMLYTLEDEKHNRMVDREPTSYSRSEAADRMKYGNIYISDKYIYRDAFFSFQNTDVNGHYNMEFVNNGNIDLRGSDWRDRLEGAILMAFARKRQHDHIRATGGYGELREADDTYNDLNRELIRAFKLRHGKAYMGDVNFYGDDRKLVVQGKKSVYTEVQDQEIYNFGCSFVVPVADPELRWMIQVWNSDDRLPKKPYDVKQITERVDKLGGIHLIWY